MRRLLLLAVALVGSPAPAGAPGPVPAGRETVRERDALGRVRVEREVGLNDAGDFVNHGAWRSWDADGRLAGQGRYAWGKPSGLWTRWASADEAELLAAESLEGFTPPLMSRATYSDGLLEGAWTVTDARGSRVAEVSFRRGKRHGEARLWVAAGEPVRVARFEHGLASGDLEERGADGALAVVARYEGGRRREERVERYAEGGLKSREQWLGAVERVAEPDDPWRLRLARYEPAGAPLRDGLREAWWPGGQPKLRLEYRGGLAVGEAEWRHENGQLALRGAYEGGLATGTWTWWRSNGVRAATCDFRAGEPAGEWALWAADGRRERTPSEGRMVLRPDTGVVR